MNFNKVLVRQSRRSRFWKSLLAVLLSWIPNKSKRMTALASLSARLYGFDEDEDTAIRNVNMKLNLSRDCRALKIPILASSQIWPEDLESAFSRSSGDTERVSCLIHKMPPWLHYGPGLEDDIRTLLEMQAVFHPSDGHISLCRTKPHTTL